MESTLWQSILLACSRRACSVTRFPLVRTVSLSHAQLISSSLSHLRPSRYFGSPPSNAILSRGAHTECAKCDWAEYLGCHTRTPVRLGRTRSFRIPVPFSEYHQEKQFSKVRKTWVRGFNKTVTAPAQCRENPECVISYGIDTDSNKLK